MLRLISLIALVGSVAQQASAGDEFVDLIFQKVVSTFLGQEPENLNGTKSAFERYALADDSNEDVGHSTTQEILERSGFKYENHYVLATDGYITQLIRVINPRANPLELKQPPVLAFHGSITDTTTFVWASAIQHKPEVYPRSTDAGPMRSWNRSLAFMLANNGYDVWLIPTRGSNRQNQGHTKFKVSEPAGLSHEQKDEKLGEELLEVTGSKSYWDFSMDDIIEHEIPLQIEKVLEVTGASNVTILGFALSNMKLLPVLAEKPYVATKVHNYIQIAPIVTNKGANQLIKALHNVCSAVPTDALKLFLSEFLATQPTRDFLLAISKSKRTRYSLVKPLMTYFGGFSGKFNTLLDSAVIGHILSDAGPKEFQHYCQQVVAGRLQRFDYGLVKNQFTYRTLKPPPYDFSNIWIENWIAISGSTDNIATPDSVKQTLGTINQKPLKHFVAPGFNHLDLVAGFENDVYVNFPILDFLNQYQLPPLGNKTKSGKIFLNLAQQKYLEKFLPTVDAV